MLLRVFRVLLLAHPVPLSTFVLRMIQDFNCFAGQMFQNVGVAVPLGPPAEDNPDRKCRNNVLSRMVIAKAGEGRDRHGDTLRWDRSSRRLSPRMSNANQHWLKWNGAGSFKHEV